MRALTIRQPYAWATVAGGRDVDSLRRVDDTHLGLVAIHAAQRFDLRGVEDPLVRDAWPGERIEEDLGRLAFGAIVGVATLASVHTCLAGCCRSPWAERHPGMRHLILTGATELADPIVVRGRAGLWALPQDVADRVRAALEDDR